MPTTTPREDVARTHGLPSQRSPLQRAVLAEAIAGRERLDHLPEATREALVEVARAAADRSAVPGRLDGLRQAVSQLEVHVGIDLDVPTASRLPLVRLVKVAVKRLTGWYLRFIGYQVTALGHAIVSLGTTAADTVERLEDADSALQADLAALAARVAHIEELLAPGLRADPDRDPHPSGPA